MFSWAWLLQALRAEEGLDERLAVGIGITLRGDEAGEDGRAGEEGRNVSGKKKEISMLFFLANPVFDILEDATISLLRTLDVAKLVPSS